MNSNDQIATIIYYPGRGKYQGNPVKYRQISNLYANNENEIFIAMGPNLNTYNYSYDLSYNMAN